MMEFGFQILLELFIWYRNMTIDVSKVDNKEVLAMLINHFNYSIKDIRSYEELTDSEKKFIPKKLWDKIVLN